MRSLGDRIPAARCMRYALVMLRETRYAAWAVQDGLDGVLADRLVARNAVIVARSDFVPLARDCWTQSAAKRAARVFWRSPFRSAKRELPGAVRDECGARMDAQRDEARSASLRE